MGDDPDDFPVRDYRSRSRSIVIEEVQPQVADDDDDDYPSRGRGRSRSFASDHAPPQYDPNAVHGDGMEEGSASLEDLANLSKMASKGTVAFDPSQAQIEPVKTVDMSSFNKTGAVGFTETQALKDGLTDQATMIRDLVMVRPAGYCHKQTTIESIDLLKSLSFLPVPIGAPTIVAKGHPVVDRKGSWITETVSGNTEAAEEEAQLVEEEKRQAQEIRKSSVPILFRHPNPPAPQPTHPTAQQSMRAEEAAAPARRPLKLKLLLLGDTNVGKTSLLDRMTQDQFSDSMISTLGVDYKSTQIEVSGRNVDLQVWDTAGQDRFHRICASYYKGVHGILLVYDVTVQSSFDRIDYWMGNIRSNVKNYDSSKIAVCVVSNKNDLPDKAVTAEEGQAKADEYNAEFISTSAKDGMNVTGAFAKVAAAGMERLLQTERNIASAGAPASKGGPPTTGQGGNSPPSANGGQNGSQNGGAKRGKAAKKGGVKDTGAGNKNCAVQ